MPIFNQTPLAVYVRFDLPCTVIGIFEYWKAVLIHWLPLRQNHDCDAAEPMLICTLFGLSCLVKQVRNIQENLQLSFGHGPTKVRLHCKSKWGLQPRTYLETYFNVYIYIMIGFTHEIGFAQ